MRIALIAESFLPNVNGVTNSVLRILEYLKKTGHEALVIAPGARDFEEEIDSYQGYRIVRVATVKMPLIDSLPIGVPSPAVSGYLRSFKPDIVHLASPFVLGGAGALAARQLRLPALAVFQTDIAGFSQRYHLSPLAAASWEWIKTIHNACQRTLAPSTVSIQELHKHGVTQVKLWPRGVDSVRFTPEKRCAQLRRTWDPTGRKKIIGYVGRLASEKGVHRLIRLAENPDFQIVIVGNGPERDALQRAMPQAVFTGVLGGEDLAHAFASFDLFVHPGEFETFCQTIQEAQASGVPTIAPRAGGPIDLINDRVDGRLLEVEEFESQILETARWILTESRSTQMGKPARRKVEDKTWDAMCEKLIEHYQDVIDLSLTTPLTFFGPNAEVRKMPRWAARALGVRSAVNIG